MLRRAQEAYERYLSILDTYRMLSNNDRKLYERYVDSRDNFSLMSSNDPSTQRDVKIARFKQEQELKLKLEASVVQSLNGVVSNDPPQFIAKVPLELHGDDATLRELHLAEIELCIHHAFHALDQTAQELKILALMPPTPPAGPEQREADNRERTGQRRDPYSDRLDGPISQLMNGGKAGPILNKDGKPLRPFTLLDSRQRLRDRVFRPDHSLPTMTIDEYLDEEKRRGGMTAGGGEQSGTPAEPDEDNLDKADAETMKAREWDEFTEANPKGSGNTINRG